MEFCAANGRLQPGFRFHPTNVELVMYYLKRKVLRKGLMQEMITEVDVYKFHPKDLRELASMKKDLNWYFFCPRGKKYGCGERTNRATHSGYWKATGNDRVVAYQERTVGKIKTLVFHEGKPPKGTRTDWVMHEYKLEDKKLADAGVGQDSYVLCKIFEKSGWGPKNAEQYGAPFLEEEWEDDDEILNGAPLVQHIGYHNPSTSVVTTVIDFPASTSEQMYSGAVSVSAVEQTPTSIAIAAAIPCYPVELTPTSMAIADAAIPYYPVEETPTSIANAAAAAIPSDYAVGQMLTPVSDPWSVDHFINYNAPVVEAAAKPAIASTSTVPAPTYEEDDEIGRLLDMFEVGDEINVFEGLGDLNPSTDQGFVESSWINFDEGGGLYLSDLDGPLL